MESNVGQPTSGGQDPSPPTSRVIAVVQLLADHAEASLTLSELCRELDITRSTAHAILHTLYLHRWVLRDPTSGKYAIGHGLPSVAAASVPVARALREPLHQLSVDLGMPVCLSELRASSIVVIEASAPPSVRTPVTAGVRLPFVAPFGREFVAWAPGAHQREWTAAAGPLNDLFRARMPKVLKAIRHRGYGIERLSDELIRVFTALLALDDGGMPDAVSARLAAAVADLTVIDVLPDELPGDTLCGMATISAPIRAADGDVVMTVSAQPYRELTQDAAESIGRRVIAFGNAATELLGHNESGPRHNHADRSR